MAVTAGQPGEQSVTPKPHCPEASWTRCPSLRVCVCVEGGGGPGPLSWVPVHLRPSQKSPFASSVPYKFSSSSRPTGWHSRGISGGDISRLTDVEPQAMTSQQELQVGPTE